MKVDFFLWELEALLSSALTRQRKEGSRGCFTDLETCLGYSRGSKQKGSKHERTESG